MKVLRLELINLHPKMRKLIKFLKIVLDHYDGIAVLLLLLGFFIVKVVLLARGGDLKHRDDEVEDMGEPALDEDVFGVVEQFGEACDDDLRGVLDLVEELDLGEDLAEEDLVLLG
jgi:hypothetical protein